MPSQAIAKTAKKPENGPEKHYFKWFQVMARVESFDIGVDPIDRKSREKGQAVRIIAGRFNLLIVTDRCQ
jgi:hypothetical protein